MKCCKNKVQMLKDQCGMTFASIFVMRRHVLEVHEKIRSHQCNLCSASFTNIGNLKRHIKSKHDKTKEICIICKKFFKSESMKRHIQSVHEGIKKECGLCNMTF